MIRCWSSSPVRGFPVTAGEREDPDAADAVGGPVLDLARRQGRVPVADGSEVLERARSRSHQVRLRLGLYRSSGCVHGRDRGWLALA